MENKDHPWEEITVKSWAEFDKVVDALEYNRWLFRGQSDVWWELKTSLYRLFDDMKPIIKNHSGDSMKFAKDKHENFLLKKFKANAHLYRNYLPNISDKLEWLSIMQHFGAPTRLLDVTLSAHIATFFALEQGHKDCCVFAINHSEFKSVHDKVFEGMDIDLKKEIFNNHKGNKSFIIAYEPKKTNERLVAQQGLFLVPSNNYETFDDLIAEYGLEGYACIKITIPKELRFSGVERLRRMNITSATLFPGIDGFCKSLRFQVLESTKTQSLL